MNGNGELRKANEDLVEQTLYKISCGHKPISELSEGSPIPSHSRQRAQKTRTRSRPYETWVHDAMYDEAYLDMGCI